jgi:hypothetical protein
MATKVHRIHADFDHSVYGSGRMRFRVRAVDAREAHAKVKNELSRRFYTVTKSVHKGYVGEAADPARKVAVKRLLDQHRRMIDSARRTHGQDSVIVKYHSDQMKRIRALPLKEASVIGSALRAGIETFKANRAKKVASRARVGNRLDEPKVGDGKDPKGYRIERGAKGHFQKVKSVAPEVRLQDRDTKRFVHPRVAAARAAKSPKAAPSAKVEPQAVSGGAAPKDPGPSTGHRVFTIHKDHSVQYTHTDGTVRKFIGPQTHASSAHQMVNAGIARILNNEPTAKVHVKDHAGGYMAPSGTDKWANVSTSVQSIRKKLDDEEHAKKTRGSGRVSQS